MSISQYVHHLLYKIPMLRFATVKSTLPCSLVYNKLTKHSLIHEHCGKSWDGIHQSDPRRCGSCFCCHSCHVCCHELSRTCSRGHHVYRNRRRGSWNHDGGRKPCTEHNGPWISGIKCVKYMQVLSNVSHDYYYLVYEATGMEKSTLQNMFTSYSLLP